MDTEAISKFLSYVLRHNPAHIGMQLDAQGRACVQELLDKANANDMPLSLEDIHHVLATSKKKRFAFSADETKIRALQGHSTPQVNIHFTPQTPPPVLYHGTATRFLPSIMQHGLVSKERQHVHLTTDTATALETGKRYGSPVLLMVNAQKMAEAGTPFYLAENGVWLTEHVPVACISQTAE